MKKMKTFFSMVALSLALTACSSGAGSGSGAGTTAAAKTTEAAKETEKAEEAKETSAAAGEDDGDAIEWPTGTVKLTVSASAGGGTDISARTVLMGLNKKGNFIVENNTDGNGVVAWETLKGADPTKMQDILYFNSGLYTSVATGLTDIDPINDIVPFWAVKNNTSYYLAVPKNSEFNSVKDVVDYAKANPGKLQCGVCPGDIAHILMGDVATKLGIYEDLNWVATGTDSDRITLLMGNNIDVTLINESTSINYAESGDVKFLCAVQRHPAETVTAKLRELPTLEEEGYENSVIDVAITAWAPAGASHATYQKLFETFNEAYQDQEVTDAILQRGSTPAELYSSFDEVYEISKKSFESLMESCKLLGLSGN